MLCANFIVSDRLRDNFAVAQLRSVEGYRLPGEDKRLAKGGLMIDGSPTPYSNSEPSWRIVLHSTVQLRTRGTHYQIISRTRRFGSQLV